MTELRKNISNSQNTLHYVSSVSAGTVVFGQKETRQTNEGRCSFPKVFFDFPEVHGVEGVITKVSLCATPSTHCAEP